MPAAQPFVYYEPQMMALVGSARNLKLRSALELGLARVSTPAGFHERATISPIPPKGAVRGL
jgi:hypothetical protein